MFSRRIILILGLLALLTGCTRAPDPRPLVIPPGCSWASLLADATDLRTLAEPVATNMASRMFSSCSDTGKVILASLAPEITGDMDHGFFPAVDQDANGVCATLGEFDGPGAITWVWSANPVGTIGLFLDHQKEPALKMPFVDFLNGRFLPVAHPFAALTSYGYNLHFPIVSTTHCKLVLWAPQRANLAELYYQVFWQALPDRTDLRPFAIADIQQQTSLLRQLARRLATIPRTPNPPPEEGTTNTTQSFALGAHQTIDLLPPRGAHAITGLRLTGRTKHDLQALWVSAQWDDALSIHTPLHMLAGVSSNLENSSSLPATVDGAQVTLRWFMPYASSGQLTISNGTARAQNLTVTMWTKPIDAARYPLRLHANYQQALDMPTDGGNILTLAETEGPGRFVGCVLGVESRSDVWWGEGDHIIWLDNTETPVWHGTGTEDYFGFAWCSQGIFNHPFRGQTRIAGHRAHRIAQMHRYHLLDRLAFARWGKFQCEAWGLGKGDMDWATTILWYGPGKPRN